MKSAQPSYILILSCFIVGLFTYGYFFPSPFNWGFHFLGFLPKYIFAFYLLCAVLIVVWYNSREGNGPFLLSMGEFMRRRQILFVCAAILLYIIIALFFRVTLSLLGDSFAVIYNFNDYRSGIAPLAPWNEPLSMYTLYYATSLLGASDLTEIFRSFFLTELFIGCCFIVVVFFIVKNVFVEPVNRLLTFFLLLSLPYMTFFMGYVETYSISLLSMALFVLISLYHIRGRMPFFFVPIAWLVTTLSHYINGLLGLSVLYLAYLQYRQNRTVSALLGLAIIPVVVFALFALAGFDSERLIDHSPVSHFLSLTENISPANAYSQAYTIFSVNHLVDLLNYIILISPFAVFFLLRWLIKNGPGVFYSNTMNTWFVFSLIPMTLYFGMAKLELGIAADWDVFASYFFFLNLFIASLFFQIEQSMKAFSLMVLVLFLNSLVWFYGNSKPDLSMNRFQTLQDKRLVSHLGQYMMSLRMSRYYDAQKDSLHQIEMWEHYTFLFPRDPRGYRNEITACKDLAPQDPERTAATYFRWLAVDPADDTLKRAAINFCIESGNRFYGNTQLSRAKLFYEYVVSLDSTMPKAYNNLGSVLATEGKLDGALALFGKAIALDSLYQEAFYNMAKVYEDRGDTNRAKILLLQSAKLGSDAAQQELKQIRRAR